ncbi:MAG TPA: hypothetical protein VHS58_17585 [Acetobacteraceae bacterium]|jgi:hypothetical protein|nr:hypothetical protein [Acetobacteraceae bacterium]
MNVPSAAFGTGGALLDALHRLGRDPAGRIAVVVRLSAMTPPAPRACHRRVIRAILQDSAQRHDGQIFATGNGDLVLLCRATAAEAPAEKCPPGATTCVACPDLLMRLLAAEEPDAERLVSVWPLAEAAARLPRYAAAVAAEPAGVAADETAREATLAIEALERAAADGDLPRLIRRQTGIALHAGTPRAGGRIAGRAMQPIYREVSFALSALRAQIRISLDADTDPFLFRHLATQLDARMLALLSGAFGSGGAFDLGVAFRAPTHLNLTPDAVHSPAFVRISRACHDAGTHLGIEMSLVDACADPDRFAAAVQAARSAGAAVVLEGVRYASLLMSRPGTLGADMLKLDWSAQLTELSARDAVDLRTALGGIGVHRIVLQKADSEAALLWGMAHGIRRFQGRHVEAMLAAGRIMTCAHAAGCTFRQCADRAGATDAAARAGCRNLPLLDAAVAPAPVPATRWTAAPILQRERAA